MQQLKKHQSLKAAAFMHECAHPTDIHVDGIITRPELSLDGRVLVKDGKVLI